MNPFHAIANPGAEVRSPAGTQRWRIEACVVGNDVADALFSYSVVDSDLAVSASDIRLTREVLSLVLRQPETGEEIDIVRRLAELRSSTAVRCIEEFNTLSSFVEDALGQFDDCSAPVIRQKIWDSHPRNPTANPEQSAAARRVSRDSEAGL